MPNEGGDAGKVTWGWGKSGTWVAIYARRPPCYPTVLLLLFEGRGTSSFLIVSCGSLVACTAT